MATAISVGMRVNYTPVADVALGAVVVLNDLVAVADRPIPAGRLGAVAVQGIFGMPKATGAGSAIAIGKKVYWDASASVVTETSTDNIEIGKVAKAAGDNDAEVEVLLSP